MRKLIFILPLAMLLAVAPAEAKKKNRTITFESPSYPPKELAAMHDSIVHEGYRLALKEQLAWTAEDVFYANCNRQNMMQGSLISGVFPIFSDIFFNLDTRQCIYEVKINVENGEVLGFDSIRPLSEKELAKIKLQDRLYNAIYGLDIEIQEPPQGCSFNFDWLDVGENRFRVYGIMGCSTPHVIPWGNDFSYDCDSLGNVLDQRKYHHSLILTPTVIDGKKVTLVSHSHTELHPLISATDIALFMLYSEDLNEFTVLSGGVYYRYNKQSNRIDIVDNPGKPNK